MDTTRATAETVETARVSAGLTKKALADASGIARATLYRKLDGHVPFTVDEIARLGSALGVDPSSLLRFGRAAA